MSNPTSDPVADEPLTSQAVIERLCALTEEVHRVIGQGSASDCFCGKGGYWGTSSYGGTWEQGYRNDGHTLGFIERVVREKLKELKCQTR